MVGRSRCGPCLFNSMAGARMLTREVDQVLRRRPGLGTLVADGEALRARLARERGSSFPGAAALTAAELRLLPLLSTHLSLPEIATEMFLSRNTIKSEVASIYRKLGASSRSQAVARSRGLGLLEGLRRVFHAIRVDGTRPGPRWSGVQCRSAKGPGR